MVPVKCVAYPMGLQVADGEVSDKPVALGDRARRSSARQLARPPPSAPPCRRRWPSDQRREVELADVRRLLSSALNSVFTAGNMLKRVLREFLDEAGNVARVGDQDVQRRRCMPISAVHRQREDVIQRQRADERPDPLASRPAHGVAPATR